MRLVAWIFKRGIGGRTWRAHSGGSLGRRGGSSGGWTCLRLGNGDGGFGGMGEFYRGTMAGEMVVSSW